MSNPLPDQATQTIAVLAACFAQTLGKKDPEFLSAFETSLEDMYFRMRDNTYFPSETLQAVKLTKDLVKGVHPCFHGHLREGRSRP